jgi:hypothetical protein
MQLRALNMRKVEQQIIAALKRGKSLTVGNTRTAGGCVWLHGNMIFRGYPDNPEYSWAWWKTMTTGSRLRALLAEFNHPYADRRYPDRKNDPDGGWISVRRP